MIESFVQSLRVRLGRARLSCRPGRFGALAVAAALAGCSALAPSDDAADRHAEASVQGDSDSDLAGAATESANSAQQAEVPTQVPPFSVAVAGSKLPPGWEAWIIHPQKKRTAYEILSESGICVLKANAEDSASGLLAKLDVDPQSKPVLEWRWRADALVPGADNTDGALEDSPVRVVLAFEGDKDALPVRDRMFFERVKLFTGRDMPYATLMYIWENRLPVGTVLPNPHTGRIQKVVVASGDEGLKKWHLLRRDYVADYKRAFGKPPGKLVGVAVMTDTDNTKSRVVAYYGDIRLLPD
jgi:hypothetical protein